MIWKIVATEFLLKDFSEVPIVIENLSFKRMTVIPRDDDVTFFINIVRKSGIFEIYESGSLVASGIIRAKEDAPAEFDCLNTKISFNDANLVLNRNDFYKQFMLKGQIFADSFKGILKSDIMGSKAVIEWTGNFPCFLENILQLGSIYMINCRELMLASSIQKIVIDPELFLKEAETQKRK